MSRRLRPASFVLALGALPLAACSGAGPKLASCAQGGCDAGSDNATQLVTNGDAGAPRPVSADAACAAQTERAERGKKKPVDVIFVIDNSGSMSDEIAAVRRNIDQSFASIIEQSGVDYRVILISQYGHEDTSICIDPPLSGATCQSGSVPTDGPRFFHYDQAIDSHDALCQILDTFDRPDPDGLAPHGFQDWLRPEAAKAFVLITDDNAGCSFTDGATQYVFGAPGADPFADALMFHSALLARSPKQFGVPPDVQYQFFSIVGLAPSEPPDQPLFPSDPLQANTCDTAQAPGLSYQALSIASDALRYPVCEGASFDAVFRVLAQSVIETSQADCTFELPANAPGHEAFDLSSVNLAYHPGDGSAPRRFSQVPAADSCKNDRSFFIRDRIQLCPAACTELRRDPMPEVDILYGCTVVPD